MQTVYFTTSNFIRHTGNIVDLTEYRRKLALAQGQIDPMEDEESAPPVRTRAHRRRKSVMTGLMLDYAASAALIVTALSFAVKIL